MNFIENYSHQVYLLYLSFDGDIVKMSLVFVGFGYFVGQFIPLSLFRYLLGRAVRLFVR